MADQDNAGRGENSVLFSLSNLTAVGSEDAAQKEEAPSAAGNAGQDRSGLIDLNTLTQLGAGSGGGGAAAPGAPASDAGGAAMPALFNVGTRKSNKGLVIGIVALVVVVLGLGGFLAWTLANKEEEPSDKAVAADDAEEGEDPALDGPANAAKEFSSDGPDVSVAPSRIAEFVNWTEEQKAFRMGTMLSEGALAAVEGKDEDAATKQAEAKAIAELLEIGDPGDLPESPEGADDTAKKAAAVAHVMKTTKATATELDKKSPTLKASFLIGTHLELVPATYKVGAKDDKIVPALLAAAKDAGLEEEFITSTLAPIGAAPSEEEMTKLRIAALEASHEALAKGGGSALAEAVDDSAEEDEKGGTSGRTKSSRRDKDRGSKDDKGEKPVSTNTNGGDTPSPAKVKGILKSASAKAKSCGSGGDLLVKFSINPDGSTRGVVTVGGKLAGTTSAKCVEKIVKGLNFPASKKGVKGVKFPFKL